MFIKRDLIKMVTSQFLQMSERKILNERRPINKNICMTRIPTLKVFSKYNIIYKIYQIHFYSILR